MASTLANLSPLTVCGKILPTPQLFQNIPILHRILEEVLEDWLRAVEPYQRQIDSAEGDLAKLSAVSSGFVELQPSLLKSLFSYAFFYRELNQANNLSGIRLGHRRPPTKTSFVSKIGMVRDIAIAHFPSEKADTIDAYAAMSWQPMALSWSREGHIDLEKLTFGPGCFRGTDTAGQRIQSQDIEIPGVKTAHYGHCLPYLNHCDEVCSEYLNALQAAVKGNV